MQGAAAGGAGSPDAHEAHIEGISMEGPVGTMCWVAVHNELRALIDSPVRSRRGERRLQRAARRAVEKTKRLGKLFLDQYGRAKQHVWLCEMIVVLDDIRILSYWDRAIWRKAAEDVASATLTVMWNCQHDTPVDFQRVFSA